MREGLATFVEETLPEMDPVIATEIVGDGWRGLTYGGEVLEVAPVNGRAAEVPSEIIVAHRGQPIGRRAVRNDLTVDIGRYLDRFNLVVTLYKANRIEEALAVVVEPLTLRAKFNRSMVLLAAGQWSDGLREYWECEQLDPFMRPQVKAALAAGAEPWLGEDLKGKRLAVIHAHGFGDTIQMLRYLPRLQATGADIEVAVPCELDRLVAGRFKAAGRDFDYFCPILHLLYFLGVTPDNVRGASYLRVDDRIVDKWLRKINSGRRKIGLAWSIGKPSLGDYPRPIPLKMLVDAFGGYELHSVQIQGADEAKALGVKVHEFSDFADCAAVMSLMDEIISVDTAALHLAGAIGHPRVFGLLSHWHSWRWVAPWYGNVRLCKQRAADDWASALAQVK